MNPLVEPRAPVGQRPASARRGAGNLPLQVAIVVLVAAAVAALGYVTNQNLETRGIATGFDFLWRPSGIPIANASIPFTAGVDSYARAVVVGLVNTLKVSIIVIVMATILGTAIGVAGLSSNWLLARVCRIYVEVIRNVPLLLQLVFWYQLFHHLPGPRQAISPIAGIYLTNRGLRFPSIDLGPATGWILAAAVFGIAGAVAFACLSRGRNISPAVSRTAEWSIAILPAAATAVLLGVEPQIEIPKLAGFDFRGGGTLSVELAALLLGLTLYASAFASEIVRSGIMAVPKGQWEAAAALGLPRRLTLRKVVLPQMMRIVIPPMTGEYLGIVKNSSLAIVVGYQDLVAVVNGMLSDTGQAIEGILIIVAAYLAISLAVSFGMSRYEVAMALRER